MWLYLLKRKGEMLPVYDAMSSLVVRANGAMRARIMAAAVAKDEGPEVWIDPECSTCKRLTQKGKEAYICIDVREG